MEPTLEADHFGRVIVPADISGYTSFLEGMQPIGVRVVALS